MGLFRRNQTAVRKSMTKARPSISSEAQASELRVRARRRLAGAVALVLAAVVVLPMLLDSEPVPVADDISIRIPDRNTSFQASLPSAPAQTVDTLVDTPAAAGQVTPPPAQSPASKPSDTNPQDSKPEDRPKDQPKPKAEPKEPVRAQSAQPPASRTDDGAVALALLEGRSSATAKSAPKPAAKGNFVVQVASYGSQSDAQARREKLFAAGITNAFIEPVTVNGKSVFRLRVGSFPSREAAQAAQTRLRTLGYENGFITTQ